MGFLLRLYGVLFRRAILYMYVYIYLKAHAPLPPALKNSTTKRVGAVMWPFWPELAAFVGFLGDRKRLETVPRRLLN